MPTTPRLRSRLSARERRAAILHVAIPQFAAQGYAGCTAAIAERAGISHPYLFRLYPTKKALFLACLEEVARRARDVLADAADPPAPPEARLGRMASALRADALRDQRRFLMQTLAAAAGDPEIRAAARLVLGRLVADAVRLSGASPRAVARSCAELMLVTTAEQLDLSDHAAIRGALP